MQERPLVMITGATSGIGLACAKAFAAKGYDLLLIARREQRLQQLGKELQGQHSIEVTTLTVDLRQRQRLQELAHNHQPLLTKTAVLINNAGLARGLAPLHGGDVDDWEEMVDTNIKGLLYITRLVLPHMVEKNAGHIINIGSIAGRRVYPGGAVYCGTKFAVSGITEALRMDLHGTAVRVSTIDPGLVETEFSLVRFHGDTASAKKVYQNTRPLRGEDVAEAVLWTAERPKHVNVQEILIMPTDQAAPTMVHRHRSG